MSFGANSSMEVHRVFLPGYPIGDAQNGAFLVKHKGLKIIISNGEGWEHVSVSRKSRTPSYEDMDWVKRQFWSDDCCVMQLHVPSEDHINNHAYCLHLWRPTDQEIPRPPSIMVGY
jgi:hypothetical protein